MSQSTQEFFCQQLRNSNLQNRTANCLKFFFTPLSTSLDVLISRMSQTNEELFSSDPDNRQKRKATGSTSHSVEYLDAMSLERPLDARHLIRYHDSVEQFRPRFFSVTRTHYHLDTRTARPGILIRGQPQSKLHAGRLTFGDISRSARVPVSKRRLPLAGARCPENAIARSRADDLQRFTPFRRCVSSFRHNTRGLQLCAR